MVSRGVQDRRTSACQRSEGAIRRNRRKCTETVFKSVALRFSWFLLIPYSTVESRVYNVLMLAGIGSSLLLSPSWLANG